MVNILKNHNRSIIVSDILAGTVVFLVAIPLCIGVAHTSGAPMVSGLIAGIIGGIFIGYLGPTHSNVSGPAAGMASLVLASIQNLGSFSAMCLALFLSGVLQLLLAKMRFGILIKFFPSSVIKGMLTAIGAVLVIKQVPHMLGYDFEAFGAEEFQTQAVDLNETYSESHASESNTFSFLWHSFTYFKLGPLLIGMLSLGLLIFWDFKIKSKIKKIPGTLVAIFSGILLNEIFERFVPAFYAGENHLVNVPSITAFQKLDLPLLNWQWQNFTQTNTYFYAFTFALVAGMQNLLSLQALTKIDPNIKHIEADKEMLVLGWGNIICGLLGGIPISSVIVRSAVNVRAGARTNLSVMVHGVWLLLAWLFFSHWINQIPLACLASLLVYTGVKMFKWRQFETEYKAGKDQFIPFVATVSAILLTDMLWGLLFGFIIASLFVLYRNLDSTHIDYRDYGPVKRIVLGHDATFLHKVSLQRILNQIPANSVLEIDASKAHYVDSDLIDIIRDFRIQGAKEGIHVVVGGIPQLEIMDKEQKKKMAEKYLNLLKNNREFVDEKLKEDPQFFEKLSEGQAPQFLFIGCSDSRVPIENITKTAPGDIFVHRNIANIVSLSDINLLSVVQYSVEVLNVRHIIVCGHYQCGGIRAALSQKSLGLIDNWISSIKMVVKHNSQELDQITDPDKRERRVVELHVLQQVRNLYKTSIVQNAIANYSFPQVHAWVYDLKTGLIKDLQANYHIDKNFHPVFKYLPN